MTSLDTLDHSIKRLRWLAWCGDEGRKWAEKAND